MDNPEPSARILNVEDDSPARFLESRILERAGFPVVAAVTAVDAVKSGAADDLRLVLLDLRLRDGDGFMVCERIKASRPSLPVVLITSTLVPRLRWMLEPVTGSQN